LLARFSSRARQVDRADAALIAAGFAPGGATHAAAQRRSRAPKKVRADAEILAIQHALLADTGWTPEQVGALGAVRDRRMPPPSSDELTALFDRLAGPHGLTEQHPTFTVRDVAQAVASWAVDRLDPEDILSVAERFLAGPRAVLLDLPARRRRNLPDPTYTTVNLLEVEDTLLSMCRQGRVDHGGPIRAPVDPVTAERAITEVGAALPEGLSAEQADLVRRLLAAGDLVRPVVGPAGTGKTEALRAATAAWSAEGYAVLGTANGGRQAEELHDRLGVHTRVVSGWLTLLDHTPDPSDVWEPGTVLLCDEATQVSTRDAERLLRYATRTGAVVVAVGDTAQLGSVGAGGWFSHLVNLSPDAPRLGTNQRQRGEDLIEVRAALASLRAATPADTRAALDRLARDGRIHLCENRAGLLAAVVDDWHTEHRAHRERHPSAVASRPVMMAERHADAELLNNAARAELTRENLITGPALEASGRQFQAGDEVITLTQTGHTLVPAGKPKSAYIRTGTRGMVTAVHVDPDHPHRQALTVRFPRKGDVRVPWDYLTHAFPDGRDGGLAHAYAITAHKAEGATLDTARAVVPEDTSRAGLYVMLSRARRDLRAYVIRRHDLGDPADSLDENLLPVLRDSAGPMRALAEHLDRSRPERLAAEHDQVAHAAHQLRLRYSLAELTDLRLANLSGPRAPLVARRAELAAEAAIAGRAVTDPPPELVVRIGPRPTSGTDRAVWDQAVAALTVYNARHRPDASPHHLGPPPPAGHDDPARGWQQHRRQAEQLAAAWAAGLDDRREHRFHDAGQTVPRRRAVVGIHALLDHGWTPDGLVARVTGREQRTSRTGAAVLDHRVSALLDRLGIDPAPYDLPAPLTADQEWQRAANRLRSAEVNYLATRSTAHLRDEHAATARRLALSTEGEDRGQLREQFALVRQALARQLDHAAARIAVEPATYLIDLLGPPPDHPALAAEWHRRALAIENYRHHVLGLPYGTPAIDDAPPAYRALGLPPADAFQRRQWDRLCHDGPGVDLGAAL
jgi:hypothetical protein